MTPLTTSSWIGPRLVMLMLCCVVLPGFSLAQRASQNATALYFGFGLSTTSIDKEAAGAEGIGSRGLGLQVRWSLRYQEIFDLSAHFGGEWVKDKEGFTQATTGGTRKSSTTPVFGGLSTGLYTPTLRLGKELQAPRVSLGGNVGYEWVLAARRGISDCIDCRSEKLHLKSGPYLEPGIELYFSRSSVLGLYYRKFASGDFGERFTLTYLFRGR